MSRRDDLARQFLRRIRRRGFPLRDINIGIQEFQVEIPTTELPVILSEKLNLFFFFDQIVKLSELETAVSIS